MDRIDPQDEERLRELLARLRRRPEDADTRQRIADLYWKMGRDDDAVKEYTRCADEYAASGHYLKALAVCKHVIEVRPMHGRSYTFISELRGALGMPGDAIAILQTYVVTFVLPLLRDGETAEALERLRALGSLHACHYDAQAVVLAAWVDADPDDPATLLAFAKALLAGGRAADAATAAERGLRTRPDDFDLLETLAFAFLKAGDKTKGRAALEQMVAVGERVGNELRVNAARKLLSHFT